MVKRKTYQPKAKSIEKKWFLVDAKGKILGRVASFVAGILRGKHKPTFARHMDTGDYVIIVNAEEIKASGKKEEKKFYFTHSGYPGGDKMTSLSKLRSTYPERILRHAIAGMLPKGRLGRSILKKLKIYKGEKHPHESAKPERLEI